MKAAIRAAMIRILSQLQPQLLLGMYLAVQLLVITFCLRVFLKQELQICFSFSAKLNFKGLDSEKDDDSNDSSEEELHDNDLNGRDDDRPKIVSDLESDNDEPPM